MPLYLKLSRTTSLVHLEQLHEAVLVPRLSSLRRVAIGTSSCRLANDKQGYRLQSAKRVRLCKNTLLQVRLLFPAYLGTGAACLLSQV